MISALLPLQLPSPRHKSCDAFLVDAAVVAQIVDLGSDDDLGLGLAADRPGSW